MPPLLGKTNTLRNTGSVDLFNPASGTSTTQSLLPKTTVAAPPPGPARPEDRPGGAATTPPPETWDSALAKAQAASDKLLAGKEPAHVVDPHAAENQAYLDYLHGRLGGMDTTAMRAEKEQGLASLDQSTAQNLERYGSIAGAHGVQGGAAASLMGQALQENNQGRASLERQLILDNITAKDNASQAYGSALAGQTANGIGMSTTNTGRDNDFTALKISNPFNIMTSQNNFQATANAKTASDRANDIAEKALAGVSGGNSNTATNKTATNKTGTAGKPTVSSADSNGVTVKSPPNNSAAANKAIQSLTPAQQQNLATPDDIQVPAGTDPTTGDGKLATKPVTVNNQQYDPESMLPDGDDLSNYTDIYVDPTTGQKFFRPGSGNSSAKTIIHQNKSCCFVVTAATDLGLVTPEFLRNTTVACPTKPTHVDSYNVWGPAFARVTRNNILMQRFVSAMLPSTVAYMFGKKSVRGAVGWYGVYIPLTYLSKLILKVKGTK